jgi:uncharacterized protein YbjT (DUF2867 family)
VKIAITTPTGNIGSVLTDRVLDRGHDVALLVRDPAKVKGFTDRGAVAHTGSLEDAGYVREATRDADVLFWLTPPNFAVPDIRAYQNELGDIAVAAAKENGIARVVHLSSLGAHLDSGTGPILGLHDNERKMNDALENVTHLRPGMFMENHLNGLDAMKQAKSIFLPVPAEARGAFIATRDIGGFAADRVLDDGWTGHHVLELWGPEELTFAEVAEIISAEMGETITHVQTPREQTVEALIGLGASEKTANLFVDMYEKVGQGLGSEHEPAPERRGKTTFREFARDILVPLAHGRAPVG